MNHTIRGKLFIWNVGLVILVIATIMISAQVFSEQIYRQKTLQIIEGELKLIEQTLKEKDAEASVKSIEDAAFRLGASISLYNDSEELLYASYQSGETMGRGRANMMNLIKVNALSNERLIDYETNNGKALLLYKQITSDNNVLVLQLPKEKIDDALWVFETLMLYVSVLALLIALVGSMILSKHFSAPIIRLKKHAEEISHLNFKASYIDARGDEIGDLGRSLNTLSITLNKTIGQLKVELDKERNIDKMRTQFIAQASHELQTPLTVLRNYIEAIEDGMVDDDEYPRHLETMINEIDEMSQLVKSLLDLSQLKSGEFSMRPASVDISQLLVSEAEYIKNQCEQLDICFDLDIEDRDLMVMADAYRIKQVIRNLLSNGLKHSDGSLSLRSFKHDDEVIVEIENSGQAIDDSASWMLFEAFFKEGKNQKKGTGMGLAIVKAIMDKHEGHYGIRNTDAGVCGYFALKTIDQKEQ